MGKFGEVAIMATKSLQRQIGLAPLDAWKQAAIEVFPNSKSSREKGCPKNAFLGLCEEGVLNGINSGDYTRSVDNKRYALDALLLLRKQPTLSQDKNALWRKILNGANKKHNAQMDVVVSLWENDLFVGH